MINVYTVGAFGIMSTALALVPDVPGSVSRETILITTIGGFLTLIVTQIFDMVKRNRQHKWDAEERNQVAAALAAQVELARVTIQNENTIQRKILADKIDSAGEQAEHAAEKAGEKVEKILTKRGPMLTETHDNVKEGLGIAKNYVQ